MVLAVLDCVVQEERNFDGRYHFLDLATGTANVALALADEARKRKLADFDILGIESPGMMDVGQIKIQRAGWTARQILLHQVDARNLVDHLAIRQNGMHAVTPHSPLLS